MKSLTSRLWTKLWRWRHPGVWYEEPGQLVARFDLPVRAVPRYVLDQLRIRAARRARGPQPWITGESLHLLDQLLRPTDRGLEFGAGSTTEWFARRVEFLHSVDGFAEWCDPLRERLATQRIENVDLVLADARELGHASADHRDAYVNAHPDIEPGSLDFVFIDGEYRDDCALRALSLLKPTGLLVLDNANAYLPSASRAPWQLRAPASQKWEEFSERIADWRRIWTTNGCWDTAIWIKPATADRPAETEIGAVSGISVRTGAP